MRQLHIRAAAALFALSLGQHAAIATPMSGLLNDGHLGNLSQYVNFQSDWVLNTDDGNLYANSGFGLQLNHQFNTTTVSVSGQTARLFDFGNFDLIAGLQLRIVGGLPVVVAATGDFNINGALSVTAGGGTGGLGAGNFDNGHSGSAAGGGGGQGGGAGFRVSGGGGGGGGNISAGQDGFSGTQHDYPPWVTQPSSGGTGGTGGAASLNPAGTFQGGGGGGGGGFASGDFGFQEPGSSGGAGGGAVLFLTTGNFSVGSAGTVSANGASVPYNASQGGGGGGGAGGTIWFDVGGVFNINSGGLVSARGGAGGITDIQGLSYFPPLTNSMGGAGSGGFVYIDPTEIINDGIIDVSDGANGSANGGLVTLIAPLISGTGRIVGQTDLGAAVPEPVSLALVCIGLAGLGATRRRQAAPRQEAAVT